jgi:hypothetical protein
MPQLQESILFPGPSDPYADPSGDPSFKEKIDEYVKTQKIKQGRLICL